jgi:hypothetical protein
MTLLRICCSCLRPVMAHRTRRLGRQAGPVTGVLLPHRPVGRNGALDPQQTSAQGLSCKRQTHNSMGPAAYSITPSASASSVNGKTELPAGNGRIIVLGRVG